MWKWFCAGFIVICIALMHRREGQGDSCDLHYRFKKNCVRRVQDSGSVIFVCCATRITLATTFLINTFHY